jgi:DNA topoisomerase VI subunit B
MIEADSDLAERILVNLLDNAIKHSPPESVVKITREISGPWAKVIISDHGEGIPADFLPRIFEKYSRSGDRNPGGSRSYGLGLAFCRMAVELHGGTIGASSEPGKGTRVWFTLPLSANQNQPSGLPAASSPEPGFTSENTLLLTEEEIAQLRTTCAPLRYLTVHQITDIKTSLNKIGDHDSPGLVRWKKDVISAMYDCDHNKFKQLVNIIS